MIKIGMTTFSEHGDLLNKKNLTLEEYASFFPVIELDTCFYGIRDKAHSQSWVEKTPSHFKFIVKAYKGMTKHRPYSEYYESEKEMFAAFEAFLEPLVQSGKLGSVLFQFPANFTCTTNNVKYLRLLREYYPRIPISIEFRNGTWYHEKMKEAMITFMKTYHYTLVTVDQPQVAHHSVPLDFTVTNEEQAFIRLHGRNKGNWLDDSEEWRSKRNLYCYSERELSEFQQHIQQLQAKEIMVIFNNNSDKDAAPNGMQLKELLGVEYHGLNPNQTSLF